MKIGSAIIFFIIISIVWVRLSSAEERYFAVTAYNEWGESDKSVVLKGDIPEGCTSVTLIWNPVEQATGYKVYWGKVVGVFFPGINIPSGVSHIFVRCPAPTEIRIDLDTGEISVIN